MGFDKSKVKKTISSGYADLESALNHLLDNWTHNCSFLSTCLGFMSNWSQ
jgi:hypothetical protein